MRRLFRYIAALCLCLAMGARAFAQDRVRQQLDDLLGRYEALCRQCMDVRTRVSEGAVVSRNDVQSLLNRFVAFNKELKLEEGKMTVVQRSRFEAIGKWFSTGVEPQSMPEDLPSLNLDLVCCLDVPAVEMNVQPMVRKETVVKHASKGALFVLTSFSVPEFSGGLMAGYQYGKWGGYVSARSNFVSTGSSYDCTSDGRLSNGARFWSAGGARRGINTVCAGGLAGLTPWLTMYAGLGYGSRKSAWQDIDGAWALVSDKSYSGIAAECGALFSWRNLTFSAGVSTIAFRAAAFTCGVGIRL